MSPYYAYTNWPESYHAAVLDMRMKQTRALDAHFVSCLPVVSNIYPRLLPHLRQMFLVH